MRKRTGRFTARPARVRVARFGSDSGTGGGVREEVAEAVAYLGAEPLGPVPEVPVEDGEMLCVPVEDETWAVVRALQGRINGDVCGVLKAGDIRRPWSMM